MHICCLCLAYAYAGHYPIHIHLNHASLHVHGVLICGGIHTLLCFITSGAEVAHTEAEEEADFSQGLRQQRMKPEAAVTRCRLAEHSPI